MSAQNDKGDAAEATVTMTEMVGDEGKRIPIRLPDWRNNPDRNNDIVGPEHVLTVTKTGRLIRTDRQLRGLDMESKRDGWPDEDPLFGEDLHWSCYRCKLDTDHPWRIDHLFLFNVIVALEWCPSPRYLRQLRRGLTQASNLLYDVTNGQMGFGKVIIADETWMDCADIQMMASNRLLPRSWTGGLIQPAKYAPIRVGRGVRVRDRREILGWDEADAYHALVHEWLHYALGLRDRYMADPRDYSSKDQDGGDEFGPVKLVLPISGHGSTSIMATPVGNSEMFAQDLDVEAHERYEQGDFANLPYPGFSPNLGRHDPGPYQLPLPLPIFRLAGAFHPDHGQGAVLAGVMQSPDYRRLSDEVLAEEDCGLLIPDAARFKPFRIDDSSSFTRWDVAILSGDSKAGNARVVAQGFIDATALSAKPRRFGLLGFAPGARVLVTGNHPDVEGNGLASYLGDAPNAGGHLPLREIRAPDERPFVDVFVDTAYAYEDIRDAAVRYEVDVADWEVTLLPHGQQQPPDDPPRALEGQILLQRGDETLLVCSYSRGGVPPTIGNSPTNPISAGSTDGGALIFGHADKERDWPTFEKASRTIVVTTSIPWLPNDQPRIPEYEPGGPQSMRPLSNVFSITSSLPFVELTNEGRMIHPTLVIFYEAAALHAGESLLLCRHVPDEEEPKDDEKTKRNSWTPVRIAKPQDLLVAIALDSQAAPDLYADEGGKLVNRYCLFAVKGVPQEFKSAAAPLTAVDAGVNAPAKLEAARVE